MSGKSADRPELGHCLKALRSGDTLVVWRLDRLGRSLPDLVGIVSSLEREGVAFESITERIETTSAAGKLIFHVFAALASGCSCWVVAALALSITTRLLRGCLRNSRLTPIRHLRWSGRPGWMRERNTSVEKSQSCVMSRLSTLTDQARNTTGLQIWLLGTPRRSTLRRALRQRSFRPRKPTARFS